MVESESRDGAPEGALEAVSNAVSEALAVGATKEDIYQMVEVTVQPKLTGAPHPEYYLPVYVGELPPGLIDVANAAKEYCRSGPLPGAAVSTGTTAALIRP